jgi:long-chain acyl-CoA synthetase
LLYLPLRGMSRERLEFLAEEYFEWFVRPRLRDDVLQPVRQRVAQGQQVLLASGELDLLLRPLTRWLGARGYIANRLEFRADLATGRLLDPVIPIVGPGPEPLEPARLARRLRWAGPPRPLEQLVQSTSKEPPPARHLARTLSRIHESAPHLSVRQTFAGKQILLLGATGFIGKVWLSMLLEDLPEVSRIHVLIRKSGSRSALIRFEKLIAESPVFQGLHERHGAKLGEFLASRVEVLEGDVSLPRFGLDEAAATDLQSTLDLVVNSSGQTDFNPDLRDAIATNTAGVFHLLDFLRGCKHAALMHLSTCFVSGRQDGRIPESIRPNDCPKHSAEFNANREYAFVRDMIERLTQESEGPERTGEFRSQILAKHPQTPGVQPDKQSGHGHNVVLDEKGILHRIRKLRGRWLREQLIEFGIQQAAHWGWPNIYTYTKALGESLLHEHGSDVPITIVRPSIVESALKQPFTGWNEGVNGSAPITFLVDTHVRQLPANPRQQLDIIPVDVVCRGLTLIGAALMNRRHEAVYQLATSVSNPAEVERVMELACLAHRKHYWNTPGSPRSQRVRSDTIVVTQQHYLRTSLPLLRRWLERWQGLRGRFGRKSETVARKLKLIERCQKIIELYAPFIHDNEYHFVAENIDALSEALVDEERADFAYEARSIAWADYWINIHVPALRRWLYPVMEGRQPETCLPSRQFKMPPRAALPTAGVTVNGHFANGQPIEATPGLRTANATSGA